MPAPVSSAAFAALAAGALAATVVDLRSRRIPNALTATMSGIGIGLAASGVSGISLGAAMFGFVLGFALMLPGHAFGATGAGDVKLMAAVGAILGPAMVVTAFLFTAVAGGVIAVMVAARRRRLAATFAGTGRLVASGACAKEEFSKADVARRFAYAPAIAIGSVLAALIG